MIARGGTSHHAPTSKSATKHVVMATLTVTATGSADTMTHASATNRGSTRSVKNFPGSSKSVSRLMYETPPSMATVVAATAAEATATVRSSARTRLPRETSRFFVTVTEYDRSLRAPNQTA